ncbi:hypothetical protein TIFTF001_008668 [Ficus carica]|uniref:Uncharacterized protein n=1 Tax=Ficus carica TaxID=3494 RepID=A0AA87ZLU0_FICCA|nr:hypothetical protein TIFTF001_008668 [Ficus carica]
MESAGFRHRRSPSSDRFLGIFTLSPPSSSSTAAAAASGGELIEAEVFWTNDFPEPRQDHGGASAVAGVFASRNRHRSGFSTPLKSGILAVLPEPDRVSQVLCRKASISPSSSVTKSIPMVPRPQSSQEREIYSQSMPAGKLQHQSAPMNVPVPAKAMAKRRNFEVFDPVADDDDEEDDKVFPPHEIVARGSGVSPTTTFSVLEGVGRTLKGRDLRQFKLNPFGGSVQVEPPIEPLYSKPNWVYCTPVFPANYPPFPSCPSAPPDFSLPPRPSPPLPSPSSGPLRDCYTRRRTELGNRASSGVLGELGLVDNGDIKNAPASSMRHPVTVGDVEGGLLPVLVLVDGLGVERGFGWSVAAGRSGGGESCSLSLPHLREIGS